MSFVRKIGRIALGFVASLGFAALFLAAILTRSKTSFARFRLTLRQIYFAGALSTPIVAASGLFMGLVLGLQLHNTLSMFKAADALGMLSAMMLLRELGPVLSALLFAAAAGTAITSEIGLMRSEKQLDAMSVMAVDPIARVAAPRFWAGVISMPLLTAICEASGIFGVYLIGVRWLGLDEGLFWSQMQAGLSLRVDVVYGVIKGFVFGAAVSLIAVASGWRAAPTAEGVSRAATRSVVTSAMAVLALDFVLTAFMY